MIDLEKLQFWVASRDASGRPVLLPKAKPAEFAKADRLSRRHYALAAAREFEKVGQWAAQAALPNRPDNWDKGSALDHRQWALEAKKGQGQ
jgi:hypothetical protein